MSRVETIEHYLNKVGLSKVLRESFSLVLEQTELPRNPYYGIIDTVRQAELGSVNVSNSGFRPNELESNALNEMTHVKEEPRLWGMPHLMKYIDIEAQLKLLGILKTTAHALPLLETFQSDSFTGKTFSVLTGPCTLYGKLLPHLPAFELEQHYLITGKKFEKAINFFAKHLMKDLFEAQQSGKVMIEGIYVPVPSRKKNQPCTVKLWTDEMMKSTRTAFVTAVKTAFVAKKECYADALYRIHSPGRKGTESIYASYLRVRKKYCLHHRENEKGSFRSFCEDPSKAIREGLFFSQDSAQEYESFAPKKETLDIYCQKVLEASTRGDFRLMYECVLYYIIMKNDPEYLELLRSICEMTHRIPQQLHAIQTQGQILLWSMEYCQRIVSSQGVSAVLNKDKKSDLVKYTDVILEQFQQFNYSIRRILNTNCTSSMSGLEAMIDARLIELEDLVPVHLSSLRPITGGFNQMTPVFEAIDDILTACSAVEISVARDIALLESKAKEEDPSVENKRNLIHVVNFIKKPQEKVKSKKKKKDVDPIISYEIEPADPVDQVINAKREIRKAIVQNEYPSLLIPKAVRLQYIADCRLDSAFETALHCILLEGLVPNPYPQIVQGLNTACTRHDLWTQTDEQILSHYQANTIQTTNDSVHYVALKNTTATGISAVFGSEMILRFINPDQIVALRQELLPVFGIPYGNKGSAYDVTVCTALMGLNVSQCNVVPAEADPFNTVDIVEHIVIEGQHLKRSVEIFSDVVFTDVVKLIDQSGVQVKNVATGHGADRWFETRRTTHAPSTILNRKEAFKVELQRSTRHRDMIVLRAVLLYKKRYIALSKHYCFHFVALPMEVYESYAPKHISWPHTCVFFLERDANLILQAETTTPMAPDQLKPHLQQLQARMSESIELGDYLKGYRHLLEILSADSDEILPDILRLMESPVQLWDQTEICARVLLTVVELYIQHDQNWQLDVIKSQFSHIRSCIETLLDRRHYFHLKGLDVVLKSNLMELDTVFSSNTLTNPSLRKLKNVIQYVKCIRYSLSRDFHLNSTPKARETLQWLINNTLVVN